MAILESKRTNNPLRNWLDWLFKDLNGRRGKYVIAEAPNLPLMIFMVSIILAVVIYPGIFQQFFALLAYAALSYWGYHELRTGRSRFRRILGLLGLIAVIAAVILRLGFQRPG